MIDPAMLRAGRLDKKFYLPPPDFEARKSMFELYLKNRPLDFGIDYEKLAHLTEFYVSSDIEFLVNESSREALKFKSRITMELLEQVISNTSPSVPLSELKKYEKINSDIHSGKTENEPVKSRIGFKP
jgi:transitional endoplasmic reticulum ATPase